METCRINSSIIFPDNILITGHKPILKTPQKQYINFKIRSNKKGKVNTPSKSNCLRCRRRPEERIFLKRLKRKPPQKSSNARQRIPRTIIHIHSNDKHHYISHNEERYQPREPSLEMLHLPVHSPVGTLGSERRSFHHHGVDGVAALP